MYDGCCFWCNWGVTYLIRTVALYPDDYVPIFVNVEVVLCKEGHTIIITKLSDGYDESRLQFVKDISFL